MKTPEHTPEEPQNDNKLHLTSVSSLLVWAAVCAFCAWLMVSTFYSTLADFTIWVSIPVIILAIVDGILAFYIHRAIERNQVGQDHHQLHPVRAARAFVLGRASAFAGAVFCGAGIGSGVYVAPHPYIICCTGRFSRHYCVYRGRFPAGGGGISTRASVPNSAGSDGKRRCWRTNITLLLAVCEKFLSNHST